MKLELKVEETIEAAPERVFALVTDIEGWPGIVKGIERIEILTPGPVAPGTRFRESRKMFGRSSSEEMVVETIDAPRVFRVTSQNHGTAYVADHRIEKVRGGTRLTLRFEGRPLTLTAKAMFLPGLLMMRAVKRQLEGDLADIKRAAESSTNAPAEVALDQMSDRS